MLRSIFIDLILTCGRQRGTASEWAQCIHLDVGWIVIKVKVYSKCACVLSFSTRSTYWPETAKLLYAPEFNVIQLGFWAVLKWTSRSAIAAKPRCSVYKLRQKSNCEKRASNIAPSYRVDVDKWSFDCFTSLCLYLMQNYAAFRR